MAPVISVVTRDDEYRITYPIKERVNQRALWRKWRDAWYRGDNDGTVAELTVYDRQQCIIVVINRHIRRQTPAPSLIAAAIRRTRILSSKWKIVVEDSAGTVLGTFS